VTSKLSFIWMKNHFHTRMKGRLTDFTLLERPRFHLWVNWMPSNIWLIPQTRVYISLKPSVWPSVSISWTAYSLSSSVFISENPLWALRMFPCLMPDSRESVLSSPWSSIKCSTLPFADRSFIFLFLLLSVIGCFKHLSCFTAYCRFLRGGRARNCTRKMASKFVSRACSMVWATKHFYTAKSGEGWKTLTII